LSVRSGITGKLKGERDVTVRSYFTPESLAEALDLKASHGYDLHVIAGGTLLMPQINDGLFFPELVMGLRGAGMDAVQLNGSGIIGAAATMSQMESQDRYPILQEAAHGIGGWAVRNMATIGGNLFNQPPYGDFAVALLALGSKVKIESASGERPVDLDDFMSGGRHLEADELVTEVHIPAQSGQSAYRKFGRRKANAATIVTVAAQLDAADGVINAARVALGGADATARRSAAAEGVLNGASFGSKDEGSFLAAQAAAAAASASNPISDAVATEWYRRQMIEVQLKRLLSDMLGALPPQRRM
jgi:CO/xanthine dehydrogenase FAD-binding subunit